MLPGDGVGPEVTREAVRILRAVADIGGHDFRFEEALIGGAAIRKGQDPLPAATLDLCHKSDAVLLGAVGAPEFDHLPAHCRPESALLLLRKSLGGFANLRPGRFSEALVDVLPFRADIVRGVNVLVVRELLGGIYYGEPRGIERNGSSSAFDTMRYSQHEIERVAHIAFQEARRRKRKVTSVDKANVLETSRLWREVVTHVGQNYPDVSLEHMYVDACATALATRPRNFDVILTENLFGDILSDQIASLCGGLGMLPSASLGGGVDLYEPVHGSAPTLAGKNTANPLGAICSAAMLLRYTAKLEPEATLVENAVECSLRSAWRTADLICHDKRPAASTTQMGDAVEFHLSELLHRQYPYHAV